MKNTKIQTFQHLTQQHSARLHYQQSVSPSVIPQRLDEYHSNKVVEVDKRLEHGDVEVMSARTVAT